jgi:uncharacterized membrane protein YeiH
LDTSFSIIIFILDLFGTAAFAVTGALRAIEHKYDIVGVIILATVTGILGGVMRDAILGIFPPHSFDYNNCDYHFLSLSKNKKI